MFIVLFSYKYFCFSGKSVVCKSGICKRSKIVESVSPFQVLDIDLQLGNITVVGVTSKSTAAECGIECDNNEDCQVKPLMRNKHRGNREFPINNILFTKKKKLQSATRTIIVVQQNGILNGKKSIYFILIIPTRSCFKISMLQILS